MRTGLLVALASAVVIVSGACGSSGTSSKTPTTSACGAPVATAVSTSSCVGSGSQAPTAVGRLPDTSAHEPSAASFDGVAQEGLTLGKSDVPVKINLYQNFLCPHCRDFALQIMPAVIHDYVATGKASITFHDAALGGGVADTVHEAAHCAADQGKFWLAYLVLYQNFSDDPATTERTIEL